MFYPGLLLKSEPRSLASKSQVLRKLALEEYILPYQQP